jgi:hypothetical protein
MAYVFKIKDGFGLNSHFLRASPQKDGAISAYRKNKTGPCGSGLLELVAFQRADEWFKKSKEYREYKAKNGDVDPFGPTTRQPHFEVDFIVSILFQPVRKYKLIVYSQSSVIPSSSAFQLLPKVTILQLSSTL